MPAKRVLQEEVLQIVDRVEALRLVPTPETAPLCSVRSTNGAVGCCCCLPKGGFKPNCSK